MCGIAGWIAPARSAPADEAMAAVLEAIAHRGPDDEGVRAFYNAGTGHRVVLGHRRLAIIDLLGARQPMCDDAAGIALSFNGEIYNFRELRAFLATRGYRFERDSDTEVLLRAYQHWGRDAVQHLRGQFAFAVWDGRREELVLARDRFGEKPLYLCEHAGGLYFASEIKALLRIPGIAPAVDAGAVWDYLAYRYVPAPRTLFAGIRKLGAGSLAVWQLGRLRETRYWTPPDRLPRAPAEAPGEPVEAFLERLDEAVRVQLVADVPFGAFLSGGLDSSTVVALMSRHCSGLRTFSVGFEDARYSELPYAAQVARQFGTAHHEIIVSQRSLMSELPRLVAYRDAPVSEPSDIPIYLLAQEAARSVKMVLSGEGSDELLGGYPKHLAERLRWAWRGVPRLLRSGLIAPLTRVLPYGFRRAKTAVATLDIDDWQERCARWFGAFDRAERERLARVLGASLSPLPAPAPAPAQDADPRASPLRRALYFDQVSWLPDNLLERGDRMTMASSIELRVPYLDHRFAEHVSRLPDEQRVRGFTTKWILREAAKRLLPRAILERPKVGFRVPVNEWFRGEMREYLLEHLRSAQSLTRHYYDGAVLDRLLDEHLDGRQNHEKALWTLLNLEIWHRTYRPA